jgi:hypothetical protein
MRSWERAFVFGSGLVCALTIVALARFADDESAKQFVVAEAQPVAADFDWREVQRARAVRIPDGPAPDIEVRVGAISDDQRNSTASRVPRSADGESTRASRLASGPATLGVAYSESDGFSGQSAIFRFGAEPTDLQLRVEDFYDFGPPFEHVAPARIGANRRIARHIQYYGSTTLPS